MVSADLKLNRYMFGQLFGATPNRAQEVARTRLLCVYDGYVMHLDDVVRWEKDPQWMPYDNIWQARIASQQKLDDLHTRVRLANYFFPDMELGFFVEQAEQPHAVTISELARQEDLTPQQRYLLTGKR